MDKAKVSTDKYKHCNHYHELTDDYELIDLGHGEFVANKQAVPLLRALNEIGLETRSHHIDDNTHAWVAILMDNIESVEVREVHESRVKYTGKQELLITWKRWK